MYIKLSLYFLSFFLHSLLQHYHDAALTTRACVYVCVVWRTTQEDGEKKNLTKGKGEKRVKLEALKTGSKEREKSDEVSPKAEKRIHIKGEALLIDRDSPSLESRGLLFKERSDSLEKPYEGILDKEARSPERRRGPIEKSSFLEKTGSFEKTASVMEKTISKQLMEKAAKAERSPEKKVDQKTEVEKVVQVDKRKIDNKTEMKETEETVLRGGSENKTLVHEGEDVEEKRDNEEVLAEMAKEEEKSDEDMKKQAANIVLQTIEETFKKEELEKLQEEEEVKIEKEGIETERLKMNLATTAIRETSEKELIRGTQKEDEAEVERKMREELEAEVEKQAADIVSKAIEEAVAMPIHELLPGKEEEPEEKINRNVEEAVERVQKEEHQSDPQKVTSDEDYDFSEKKANVVEDLTSLLKKLPDVKPTLKDLPSSDSSSFSSFESVKLAPHMVGSRAQTEAEVPSGTEARDPQDGEKTQPLPLPTKPTRVDSLVKRLSQEIENTNTRESTGKDSHASEEGSNGSSNRGEIPKDDGNSNSAKRPPALRSKPPSVSRSDSLVKRLSQELESQMADFPPPSPVTGATFSREASLDCQPPDTPASAWAPRYPFSRGYSRDSAPGDRKLSSDSVKSLEAVKDVDESEFKLSRDSSFDSQKDSPIPPARALVQKQTSKEGSKDESNAHAHSNNTEENKIGPKPLPRNLSKETEVNTKATSGEVSSLGKIVPSKPPRQSSLENKGTLAKQGSTELNRAASQTYTDQKKSNNQQQLEPKKKQPPPVAKKPNRPSSTDMTHGIDASKYSQQQTGELKSPTGIASKLAPPAVLPKPKLSKPTESTPENEKGTNKNIISGTQDSPTNKEAEASKGDSGEEKKDSPEKEKTGSDVIPESNSSKEAAVTNQSSALTISTEVTV